MKEIDRKNARDAKRVMEALVNDEKTRCTVTDFLSSAIVYANNLCPNNWNVNLDLHGKFIRFNVGQEYCIEIRKKRVLVLCLKGDLNKIFTTARAGISFQGEDNKKAIYSNNPSSVPDILVKTKGSVGCIIEPDKQSEYLPMLKRSNENFITEAEHTRILPSSKNAHSVGFIEYMSKIVGKELANPLYIDRFGIEETNLTGEMQFSEEVSAEYPEGAKCTITVNSYERSSKARKACVKHYGTTCGVCNFDFKDKYGDLGRGFIHVHHLTPVSEIGATYEVNPVNDLRPVCPNCHAMLHKGKLTIEELKALLRT